MNKELDQEIENIIRIIGTRAKKVGKKPKAHFVKDYPTITFIANPSYHTYRYLVIYTIN